MSVPRLDGKVAIITVSSLAGLKGGPYLTAYSASKFAVRGMTKRQPRSSRAPACASTRCTPGRSTPT